MCQLRKGALLSAFGVALLGGTSATLAAPVIYFAEDTSTSQSVAGTASQTSRNQFLSGLSGVGNEDFEAPDQVAGTTAPVNLTFPGALTATLSGSGCVDNTASVCAAGSTNPGRWPTSGTQFWEVDSGGTFNITFGTAVSAFGFYGTDIGDFDNRLRVTLTAVGGATTQFVVPHSLGLSNTANSLLFWGFIDSTTAYTSIRFDNAGTGGDVFGFDDMVIGSREQIRVPEPGTLALLALGLLGFVAARRRQ